MTGKATARLGAVGLLLGLLAVGCSDDSVPPDTTSIPTTSSTSTTSTSTSSTSTSTSSTSTSSTSTSTTSTSTTVPFPTTTVHVVPADCDVDGMLAAVDTVAGQARLQPGPTWELEGTTVFDDRTNAAEEFRDRLGLDCRLRAVQRTAAGDRLLLAAWTDARYAFVLQSPDGPSTPYAPDQNLQLLYEEAYGEWLEEQEAWAGTLSGGETVIVAVDDYSLGAAAKAWQALPRWEDLPVSIEAERYAIDVLRQAGARNVSPGEEPAVGSTIAAIQFVTPGGLPLVATVAPLGDFDPGAPIVDGERSVVHLDGVRVHLTRAGEDSYAVASVGWECGPYVWFVDSAWGTVEELVGWAAAVIAAGGCGLDAG